MESNLTVRPKAGNNLISVEQQRAIGETQAAMVVAQNFPRDMVEVRDRVMNACTRPRLAEGAVYQYSRGGSAITGPSIRLAEVICQAYGNMVSGIAEIARRNGESDCMAYAHDLQTNYRDEKRFTIKHVRDTKKGSYRIEGERDLYELIGNFGARRKRACMLAVLPSDIVEEALEACEQTLKATANVTPERLKSLVDKFAEFGVTKKQIEARIQRHLDSITPGQMVLLGRVYTSLQDGMSAPSDWFEQDEEAVAPKTGNEGLKAKLKRKPQKPAQDDEDGRDGKNEAAPMAVPPPEMKGEPRTECPEYDGRTVPTAWCNTGCECRDGCPSH